MPLSRPAIWPERDGIEHERARKRGLIRSVMMIDLGQDRHPEAVVSVFGEAMKREVRNGHGAVDDFPVVEHLNIIQNEEPTRHSRGDGSRQKCFTDGDTSDVVEDEIESLRPVEIVQMDDALRGDTEVLKELTGLPQPLCMVIDRPHLSVRTSKHEGTESRPEVKHGPWTERFNGTSKEMAHLGGSGHRCGRHLRDVSPVRLGNPVVVSNRKLGEAAGQRLSVPHSLQGLPTPNHRTTGVFGSWNLLDHRPQSHTRKAKRLPTSWLGMCALYQISELQS